MQSSSEVMNPESGPATPSKGTPVKTDNAEIITLNERLTLVKTRIGEEAKRASLREAMKRVKSQLEAQAEGPDVNEHYKQLLTSELDRVGRVLDNRFFEIVRQTLPESLEEFYNRAESCWAEDEELQSSLAQYGEYVFSEIKHAKRMHKMIAEQLDRDYREARLRDLPQEEAPVEPEEAAEIEAPDSSSDEEMTAQQNSDIGHDDLQMALNDLSEFQESNSAVPASDPALPVVQESDQLDLPKVVQSQQSEVDSCMGLIE